MLASDNGEIATAPKSRIQAVCGSRGEQLVFTRNHGIVQCESVNNQPSTPPIMSHNVASWQLTERRASLLPSFSEIGQVLESDHSLARLLPRLSCWGCGPKSSREPRSMTTRIPLPPGSFSTSTQLRRIPCRVPGDFRVQPIDTLQDLH